MKLGPTETTGVDELPRRLRSNSGLGYRPRHAAESERRGEVQVLRGAGHTKRGSLAALIRSVEPRLEADDALAIADAVRAAYPKIRDYWPMGNP